MPPLHRFHFLIDFNFNSIALPSLHRVLYLVQFKILQTCLSYPSHHLPLLGNNTHRRSLARPFNSFVYVHVSFLFLLFFFVLLLSSLFLLVVLFLAAVSPAPASVAPPRSCVCARGPLDAGVAFL